MCRLVPAILVKTAFEEAWRVAILANPEWLKWWRMGSNSFWIPEVKACDWTGAQRVAIRGNRIVGWLSLSVDRESQAVTQVSAVSLIEGDIGFLRAVDRWMTAARSEYRSIRWTCCVGNPAAKGWLKWAKANGGGELCVIQDQAMVDGVSTAAHFFQVPGRQ